MPVADDAPTGGGHELRVVCHELVNVGVGMHWEYVQQVSTDCVNVFAEKLDREGQRPVTERVIKVRREPLSYESVVVPSQQA